MIIENKNQGFTLIELIMIIIILAIFASVSLPKFANFKTKAIEKQEDSVAAALKTAIQTAHLSYVVKGFEDSWPCSESGANPFSLLAQAPQHQAGGIGGPVPRDNVTWHYAQSVGSTAYYIYCPHFEGSYGAGGAGTNGRGYMYVYGNNAPSYWKYTYPGAFWLRYEDGQEL